MYCLSCYYLSIILNFHLPTKTPYHHVQMISLPYYIHQLLTRMEKCWLPELTEVSNPLPATLPVMLSVSTVVTRLCFVCAAFCMYVPLVMKLSANGGEGLWADLYCPGRRNGYITYACSITYIGYYSFLRFIPYKYITDFEECSRWYTLLLTLSPYQVKPYHKVLVELERLSLPFLFLLKRGSTAGAATCEQGYQSQVGGIICTKCCFSGSQE